MLNSHLYIQIFFILFCSNLFAQIIDYSTEITVKNNKLFYTESIEIKISKPSEKHLGEIRLEQNKNNNLNVNEAIIVDRKGNEVRKLKKKEIKSYSSSLADSDFYNDHVTYEFSLHWHTYPYTIKYSYCYSVDQFFYICNWSPLYNNTNTESASLKVILPEHYAVNIKSDSTLAYQKIKEDKLIKHHWTSILIEKPKKEKFAPNRNEIIPHVIIVPKQFNYESNGNQETWSEFGLWVEKLNYGLTELPDTEKDIVKKITGGISDKKETVKRLYHYLQDNTRYINVTIEEGGYKPYPASYVCTNKYGDCKALTIYMQALLKEAGIDSYYTLINAGRTTSKTDIAFPSAQFNHVLLSVPLGKDTLRLENTSKYLPYDYNSTFTQNRKALLVDDEKSRIVSFPAQHIDSLQTQHEYHVTLSENNKAHIEINSLYRGRQFEIINYLKNSASDADKKEFIEESVLINHFSLNEWSILDGKRNDKFVKTNVHGSSNDLIRNIGSLKVITPIHTQIPEMEKPNNRTLPIHISYPRNQAIKTTYSMDWSDNYKVSIPENVFFSSEFGALNVEYEQIDSNTVVVYQNFKLYAGEYPLAKYKAFYQFLENMKKNLKKSAIILSKK